MEREVNLQDCLKRQIVLCKCVLVLSVDVIIIKVTKKFIHWAGFCGVFPSYKSSQPLLLVMFSRYGSQIILSVSFTEVLHI